MVNAEQRVYGAFLLMIVGGAVATSPSSDVWMARKAKATQYHTQDPRSGTYQYGYTGPLHAKTESSFNGVTRGGYSYVDANGLMQTVSYTADAENGFRVQASNLPNPGSVQDTPEVALAKRRHLEQLRRADSSAWQRPQQYQPELYQQPRSQQQQQQQQQPQSRRNPHLLSLAATHADTILLEEQPTVHLAPTSFIANHHYVVPAAQTIIAMPLPLVHSSMRHTQDSLGQYEYSYTGDTSAKTESRTLDGTTRGAYSYIDANGLLQQVHYIADKDGFRVMATNLPEA